MAEFNRVDIAEASAVLEWDFNKDGWLQERPSNLRRMEATAVQLARMQFRPAPGLSFDTLSENGKDIYWENVLKWGLPIDESMQSAMSAHFIEEFLQEQRPEIFGECLTVLRGHCQSCGRDYSPDYAQKYDLGLEAVVYWGPCPSDDCPSNNNGV